MLFLTPNHSVKMLTFPSGETQLNLSDEDLNLLQDSKEVIWKYTNNESILELLSLNSIIKQNNIQKLTLYISYMPYARMDRIKEDGQTFSLDMFVRLFSVDSIYENIIILDPHSEVTLDLFRKYLPNTNIKAKQIFSENFLFNILEFDNENDLLVFPDKGALNRYKDFYPKVFNIFNGNKDRDFSTGKIKSITAEEYRNLTNKKQFNKAYILDDICSYGGTFIGIKKALQDIAEIKEFILVVTHAENSIHKGNILTEFDEVVTTDSILSDFTSDKIKVFKIEELV